MKIPLLMGRLRQGVAALAAAVALAVLPAGARAAPEPLKSCGPEPTNVLIGYGDVVECTIDPIGDADVVRFAGRAGEVVLLSLNDMTFGGCSFGACPQATLFPPAGGGDPVELPAGSSLQTLALPVAGTYTLVVREAGNDAVETYRVALERLFPVSPTAVPLVFGAVATDTLDPVPDHDFLTLDAWAGAFASITLSDLTFGGCAFGACPAADVYAPDGTLFTTLTTTEQKNVTFTATGTYLVHLYEQGNDAVESYSFGTECITPPAGESGCGPEEPLVCNGLAPTIVGTGGNDVIVGTDGDDVIMAFGGDDVVDGRGGNDVICGGPGADTLLGGEGDDLLIGDEGDDVLIGDAGNDVLRGGKGRDALFGGLGSDRLFGDDGDDVLDGGAGDDRQDGGSGRDICQSGDPAAAKRCESTNPL